MLVQFKELNYHVLSLGHSLDGKDSVAYADNPPTVKQWRQLICMLGPVDMVWLPGLQLHPCKTYMHAYVGSRANYGENFTAHHTIKQGN